MKQHKNLCKIIQEIQRGNPAMGMGKPELLRHNLSGFWSCQLSKGERVVYKFDDDSIYIFAIGGHYDSL